MSYKTFALMNVAVIGDGGVAETIARKLAEISHNIYIGTKSEHVLMSGELFMEHRNISLTTIENAAFNADIIIMATPPDEVREAAYLLDDVRNKIILDLSGFHYPKFGNYLNTLNAIMTITYSPYVVKAYSSGGYDSITSLFSPKNTHTMYFAGNDKKSKEMMKLIARDLGFNEYYDYGTSNDVIELDRIAISGNVLAS